MTQALRVTVVTGPHRGRKFCLLGTAECLMGRSPDCFIQFAGTERDQCISRRHCKLTLDPSALTVQDLGSLCGTYLDGERIESATLSLPACNGCDGIHSERDDFETSPLLTIGGTTLRLNVVDCPPKGTSELDRANLWRRGETAKKDCPIAC
jgi:pSer/pThr/pTyr-binding forkhead associated (FHA) protein